jgi:flagellar biosynthesis protein FlhF
LNTPLPATAAPTNFHIVAPSSREALRLVREQLGADAVVLSSRVTADGVEVIATLDAPETAPAAPPASVIAEPVATGGDAVLREIHSMRGMIEEQLAGMAWNEQQRRDPVRGHLLRTLLGAGFSARLAKEVLHELPTGQNYAGGLAYAKTELVRRMPLLADEDALMDGGGVFALMGPTGVGKTTTTAKLAARCVMRFGAEKLALVTTDSYRIGAYEQLRIYGQILGVSVHAVKNAADLPVVLDGLRDKHMVLIDTVGMSQRDRAVAGQIAMLCGTGRPVKRLLLLNASSHGDTLHEVVQAYRQGGRTGSGGDLAGCIFTKVDESTHPGALIDMAIRHQLPVHYVSSGQKVPEHLLLADGKALVDSVFEAGSRSALFIPGVADVEDAALAASDEAQAAAAEAEAVSDRLRSQCQQLIKALTHNAHELATNAASLSHADIGFDETRALWRKLSAGAANLKTPDGDGDGAGVARELLSDARRGCVSNCSDLVLAVTGQTPYCPPDIEAGDDAGTRLLASTLLLSDRTGKAFSAPLQHGVGEGVDPSPDPGRLALAQALDKPLVYLFARMPDFQRAVQWQQQGLYWAACAGAALRVVNADTGVHSSLAKLAAGLSFGAGMPAVYRRRSVLMSVAEMRVSLRQEAVDAPAGASPAPVLRCVVRRTVDAATGKVLAHSYVLACGEVRVPAQSIAQWPAWRRAAEPYFKLLGQGMGQFGAADTAARRLVVGQTCTTVSLLQGLQGEGADAVRKTLAKLAGRALRSGRPVPAAVLLEGMGKLLVLLDAFDTEGMAGPDPAASTRTARAPATGA